MKLRATFEPSRESLQKEESPHQSIKTDGIIMQKVKLVLRQGFPLLHGLKIRSLAGKLPNRLVDGHSANLHINETYLYLFMPPDSRAGCERS